MSYVDTLRELIAEQVKIAESGLDRIERHGPRAIRAAVDVSLPTVPRPQFADDTIARELISRLHEAVASAREHLQLLVEASRYLGSPDALRHSAETLSSRVAARTDQLATDVRRDNLRAMLPSAWDDGDASAQYSISFEGQSGAVLKIRENALLLVDALRSMADGIEQYYADVAKAAGSAALAIGSAALAIASAPTGIGLVVGIIGALIGVVTAGMSVWELYDAATEDRGATFRDHVSALRWPTTTFAAG